MNMSVHNLWIESCPLRLHEYSGKKLKLWFQRLSKNNQIEILQTASHSFPLFFDRSTIKTGF